MNLVSSMRTDQADGLRRLFAGRRQQLVPVAANAEVGCSGVLLERLSLAFAELGGHALVVEAADSGPLPHELVDIDLAACIERLGPGVSYLAARGLPRRHVDTRGSSAHWLAEVERASPFADVLIVHAEARDLCRLLGRREVCPVLQATLEAASLTEAYASMKLLSQRLGLKAFDLLVGMQAGPKRAQRVAERLASCADNFLGAVLRSYAAIDRDEPLNRPAPPLLSRLAADQLTGLAGGATLALGLAAAGPRHAMSLE